jgi:hypothetical protein
MKKLLLVLSVMTLSLSAMATEIKVASETLGWNEELVDAKLVINADMGRAWVEYDIVEDDGEDDWYTEKRAKIDGLSFDATTGSIVLLNGATEVVCTTSFVRPRRVTGTLTRFTTNTGACSFKVRKETIVLDNGYEIVKRKVDSLYLVIK